MNNEAIEDVQMVLEKTLPRAALDYVLHITSQERLAHGVISLGTVRELLGQILDVRDVVRTSVSTLLSSYEASDDADVFFTHCMRTLKAEHNPFHIHVLKIVNETINPSSSVAPQ